MLPKTSEEPLSDQGGRYEGCGGPAIGACSVALGSAAFWGGGALGRMRVREERSKGGRFWGIDIFTPHTENLLIHRQNCDYEQSRI